MAKRTEKIVRVPVPLAEATTHDLIDELRRRSIGAIITLAQVGEGNEAHFVTWWKGEYFMLGAIGAHADAAIREYIKKRMSQQ